MANLYKFLLLEDRLSDAELIVLELKRSGFQFTWQRVDSEEDYIDALLAGPDVIIADYVLPQFDAIHALSILKEKSIDIPLIVVSGNISEETAVKAVKLGAVDYLLKDRLTRLGQAVASAIEQKKVLIERRVAQKALHESEERFRRLAENAQDIIYRYRFIPNKTFEYMSPAVTRITGYTPEEFYADAELIKKIIYLDDLPILLEVPIKIKMESNSPTTLRWRCKDGRLIWIEQRDVSLVNEDGVLEAIEGIARDVTESLRYQHELEIIAKLSEAVRKANSRKELIAVILDQILDLFQANGSALILIEPGDEQGVVELARGILTQVSGNHIPAGEGIIGWVINAGQPFISDNANDDPYNQVIFLNENLHGIACVPLITQDRVIGALMITREKPIDAYEARLLVAVSDITVNAIQRTTLYEKTIFHARQMEIVSEIGRILAEALDRPAIYQCLDQSLDQLIPGIYALIISFYDPESQCFSIDYASKEAIAINLDLFSKTSHDSAWIGSKGESIKARHPLISGCLDDEIKKYLSAQIGGPAPASGIYVPMISRSQILGVIEVYSLIPYRFNEEDAKVLSLVGNTTAVAIQNTRLLSDLQKNNIDLVMAYDSTLEGWSRAMDLRDQETEGHSQRVAETATSLAMELGISGDDLVTIQRGALLHDLGKIGIPDGILNKPGPLSDDEWVIMRRHPEMAYEMLFPIQYLRSALDIPYCHHEKWDGTGYPRGLKGEQIPLSARIFAFSDVWDALLHKRSYRPPWEKDKVTAYVREQSGIHFDPDITEIFLRMVNK